MTLRTLPMTHSPLPAARAGVLSYGRRRWGPTRGLLTQPGAAVTADDLQFFRARLMAVKAALEDEGPARLDPNRTDDIGKRDEDHQPLNEMLQAIASSRNRNRSAELQRIVAAIARIERTPGDYGLCVDCEEPIRRRRLELMPAVELCVKCQSAQEDERTGARRKSLTDYV